MDVLQVHTQMTGRPVGLLPYLHGYETLKPFGTSAF